MTLNQYIESRTRGLSGEEKLRRTHESEAEYERELDRIIDQTRDSDRDFQRIERAIIGLKRFRETLEQRYKLAIEGLEEDAQHLLELRAAREKEIEDMFLNWECKK